MNKIALSSDTPCDIGPILQERYHVSLFPLHIEIGGRQYTDNVDIHPAELYEIFEKTGELPRTSAINPEEYRSYFQALLDQGAEAVIHVSLGSGLSSSYQHAAAAASDLENVYVIDSKSLSTGIGLLVLEAGDRIEQGLDAVTIANQVTALVSKVHASFVIHTLAFLRAGGRCSSMTQFSANLMGIRPSIEVAIDLCGAMRVGKKYHGKYKKIVQKYMEDQMELRDRIVPKRVFITHSGVSPEIEQIARGVVSSALPEAEVFVTHASCTISSHCGPGTIGVLFLER